MSATEVLESRQIQFGSATESLGSRFQRLASEWKAQSEFLSQTARMAMLPSYQQIIGLGPAAVPLIIRELKREPDYWFWALRSITGEDPVKPMNRDNLERMTKDWLEWANARGIQ